ncbi:hypothetical protein [Thiohalomonas denitrificans]|uniref:hypothetical protein n=1 Tax=Thiohalomonas denitrificans TaxID=415747 RepID=UPI0026EEFEC3|nr:hypothetical protein [Thiohalomonas denitrificans]
MINYFFAMGLIMLLLLGWVSVQHLARLFAKRDPQFGAVREDGGGCGTGCLCRGGSSCKSRN